VVVSIAVSGQACCGDADAANIDIAIPKMAAR
jgi:hypothetical protein